MFLALVAQFGKSFRLKPGVHRFDSCRGHKIIPYRIFASVAQRTERPLPVRVVVGSSPAGSAQK